MSKKQKLELTWIGKDHRPRLEPRILLEDTANSHHAPHRVSENDIFDNRLIKGDNLLALKALEQEFTGKVKCIFIDPPYNTGSAFEHYDDGIEHSLWLSLIRERLELLKRLLCLSGTIWITIDDNEVHDLKILCDEVFGRSCFVSQIVWRSTDNSNNHAKQFSADHNYILVYAKDSNWHPIPQPGDQGKRGHFKNPDNDPRGLWFDGNPLNSPKRRPNLTFDLIAPNGNAIKPPKNGWRWSRETISEKIETGEIRFSADFTGIRRRTYLADMKSLPPSSLWADIEETGHNRQAKYELKNLFPERDVAQLLGTPKPEKLIRRIVDLATLPGDLVLDSFLGSGTTAAVAHKMGRRWIGIELGGITEAVEWKAGGGFRYYRLAPSLLTQDKWGQWVISSEYNREMLAEAVCKLEGFTFAPSETVYWQQAHSTERDFIYTTTANLSHDQLQQLIEEVGPERSLLVVCSAFRGRTEGYANLTVKKIPNTVLSRCEWGKDDYSLKVENLPKAPPKEGQIDLFGKEEA